MEFNGVKAKIAFKAFAVDSIPCNIKGQYIAFDEDGNLISDPLKTPWPMPWIEEEAAKYASGEYELPDDSKLKICNPEEPDQFVAVYIEKE